MGRARSLWLSLYFTDTHSTCYFEPLTRFSTFDSFTSAIGPYDGASGGDLIHFYQDLKRVFPDACFWKITRPFGDTMTSYRKLFPRLADETLRHTFDYFKSVDEPEIPYDRLDEHLPEIEQTIGAQLNPYRAELMRNTIANIKEVRF